MCTVVHVVRLCHVIIGLLFLRFILLYADVILVLASSIIYVCCLVGVVFMFLLY